MADDCASGRASLRVATHSGLDACPAHLTRRSSYEHAPDQGKAAREIDPEGSTEAEIERLYLFICEQVKKFRREHGKSEAAGRAEKRA
jgi:hypothetical protein